MPGIIKPTTALREAKVKLHELVGADVPADTRRGYTDRMEILSPGLTIAYEKSNAPSDAARNSMVAGVAKARSIMRKANNELASVVMLRAKESPLFTQVMATHFGLVAGNDGNGLLADNVVDKKFSASAILKRDRRWALEKIRQTFLSLSAHIGTGVYLIDCDLDNRDIKVGDLIVPKPSNGTEAYVGPGKKDFDKTTWRYDDARFYSGFLAGFKNGEIHAHFKLMPGLSSISIGRIVIHEATHKYFDTEDHAYAHNAAYYGLSLQDRLENADSYAWAAVSLYCGNLKMANAAAYGTDWKQCSKP